MISFKINVEKVITALQTKRGQIYNQAMLGLQQGLFGFEGHIIKAYMSGRPGLRRITGNLARSWFVQPLSDGDGGRLATRTVYAHNHEYGTTVPRRMYIRDDFKTIGRDIISKQIASRLHRLVAMGVAV